MEAKDVEKPFPPTATSMDERPPVDLHKELNAACTECAFGLEAWTMLDSGTRNEAEAEIDLMRQTEAVNRIVVRLSMKGYQVCTG